MTDPTDDNKTNGYKRSASAVPSGRVSRLGGLGKTAASIAGSMAFQGAKQLIGGKRPRPQDLLLTPGNALKLTRRLSEMRGAAMKIGQMMSMESGDFLPKEFADILAHLRSDAKHMPILQLTEVLVDEWGETWPEQFYHFNEYPIAAASIGQVHRSHLPNHEIVAVKIQYPGVRESIDSDIANVAGLLRLSGLIPKDMEIAPIIEEARLQLHQEADYIREGEYLRQYGQLLSDDKGFIVPEHYPDLSTDKVLVMSYIPGTPIESVAENAADHSQEQRDDIGERLMRLVLRELFEFGLMQTDPNFANYQYDAETDQIILLDFGATREISETLQASYRRILEAILANDPEACYQAAINIGFLPEDLSPRLKEAMLELITIMIEPVAQGGVFDFGNNPVSDLIREKALPLANERDLWYAPPPELIFIQRKLGGTYLMATRLGARCNLQTLLRTFA